MSGSFVPQIKQELNHVALKVIDMQRSLAFYHELIGLPITRVAGPENDPSDIWLPGVQLKKSGGGQSPSGTLDHLALGFENVKELCERLDAAGIKNDDGLVEVSGPDGNPFALRAFYYDPDGNRVEVFKYL